MMKRMWATTIIGAVLGVMMFVPLSAHAASQDFGQRVTDVLTQKECGACHMAFPPVQLTAAGWTKIMTGLSDHFGEDASLEAAQVQHIKAYLVEKSLDGGGTMWGKMTIKRWKKKGLIDPVRITETPGWKGAHSRPKYKRMAQDVGYARGANCVKCHKQAQKGVFEEFENLYPELGGYD